MFISDRGFAKLEIALAQGKKDFDKRETIKERDTKRELGRVMKLWNKQSDIVNIYLNCMILSEQPT